MSAHAVNDFGETYVEMITRFERTAGRLARDVTAHLTAANAVPELADTSEWRDHMRTLATVMRGLPELLLSCPPPPHLKMLYMMYEKWSGPYVDRARRLLEALDALDSGDVARYSQLMSEAARLGEQVATLSEARSVYISGALCNEA